MSRLLLGAALLGSLSIRGTAQELLEPPARVSYGESQWLDAKSCQGIPKPQCDLSSVTSDTREWYYARVSSVAPGGRSAWGLSPRFSPRWNTKISPPGLKLSVSKQGIVVHVKPARALARKMRTELHHNVFITPTEGEEPGPPAREEQRSEPARLPDHALTATPPRLQLQTSAPGRLHAIWEGTVSSRSVVPTGGVY
ncbi:unnamed protein product [Menidia menidia]|uniref:(Atlantic silverside) hypothetical protein n=1 Tax=Menidia menidia TaxID=238744 RepID=A0A8S4BXH8_9TELE|nr:unnamed protein product [Menidia menidia]